MDTRDKANWVVVAAIIAIGGIAILLFARILFADTSVQLPPIVVSGTPGSITNTTDGLVLKETNERLLQTTQWTIALVISVAAFLVGFSWFQSRSREAIDRERFNLHVEKFENMQQQRDQAIDKLKTDQLTAQQVVERIGIQLEVAQRTLDSVVNPANSWEGVVGAIYAAEALAQTRYLQGVVHNINGHLFKMIEAGIPEWIGIDYLMENGIRMVTNLKGDITSLHRLPIQLHRDAAIARSVKDTPAIPDRSAELLEQWSKLMEELAEMRQEVIDNVSATQNNTPASAQ